MRYGGCLGEALAQCVSFPSCARCRATTFGYSARFACDPTYLTGNLTKTTKTRAGCTFYRGGFEKREE
jgi:hypothetical protein